VGHPAKLLTVKRLGEMGKVHCEVTVGPNGLIDPGPSERGSHGYAMDMLCLRKAAAARAGVITISAQALYAGGLFHLGIAHDLARLAGVDVMPGQEAMRLKAHLSIEEVGKRPAQKGYDDCRRWLGFYLPAWQDYYGKWTIIAIEKEYRFKVKSHGKARLLTGRADLVMRDPYGRYWILDHKTAFEISGQTLDQYVADIQMILYRLFGKILWKENFGGVIIGRVNKRYTGNNRERATAFDPLPDADQAVEDAIATLSFWDDLRDSLAHLPWQKQPASFTQHTCRDRYRPCDLVGYCLTGMLPFRGDK